MKLLNNGFKYHLEPGPWQEGLQGLGLEEGENDTVEEGPLNAPEREGLLDAEAEREGEGGTRKRAGVFRL